MASNRSPCNATIAMYQGLATGKRNFELAKLSMYLLLFVSIPLDEGFEPIIHSFRSDELPCTLQRSLSRRHYELLTADQMQDVQFGRRKPRPKHLLPLLSLAASIWKGPAYPLISAITNAKHQPMVLETAYLLSF